MFFCGYSSIIYEMEVGIFWKRGYKINEMEMLYSIEVEVFSEFILDCLIFDKFVCVQYYGF